MYFFSVAMSYRSPPSPLSSEFPPVGKPIFKFSFHVLNMCSPQLLSPPVTALTFHCLEPSLCLLTIPCFSLY